MLSDSDGISLSTEISDPTRRAALGLPQDAVRLPNWFHQDRTETSPDLRIIHTRSRWPRGPPRGLNLPQPSAFAFHRHPPNPAWWLRLPLNRDVGVPPRGPVSSPHLPPASGGLATGPADSCGCPGDLLPAFGMFEPAPRAGVREHRLRLAADSPHPLRTSLLGLHEIARAHAVLASNRLDH